MVINLKDKFNSSITAKFFSAFVLVFIIIVLSLVIISSYFLEDIIMYTNKTTLQHFYEDNFNVNSTAYNEEKLEEHITSYGIGVTILDNNQVTFCNSKVLCRGNTDIVMMPKSFSNEINKLDDGQSKIFDSEEAMMLKNQMFLVVKDENRVVILDKAIGSASLVTGIVNTFIMMASVVVLVFGSIMIYFIARKVSTPIIKINQQAQEIADLNFNTYAEIKSQDEIGQLSRNINYISQKLNFTLFELQEKNKQLEQELEKEKEIEKMRIKFFTQISHELKTPITIIQGYADGLKNGIVSSPEDCNYYTNVIIEQTKEMTSLINELLDIAMFESGYYQLNFETFNISDLTTSIINYYQELTREKKVELIHNKKEVEIIADHTQIKKVVSNLITNAFKFVNDNGTIIIDENVDNGKLVFSVFNSGITINEEDLKEIWKPFYKDENSNGTGVGLSIVKTIIELHKGSVEVQNQENGVLFKIILPLSQNHHKQGINYN